MTIRLRVIAALSCAWLASGCATRYLPPPAAPTRDAPQVTYAPPPLHGGEGTVTFGTTTGRARVELITQRTQVEPYGSGIGFGPRGYNSYALQNQYTLRPLCVTPCVVNLPLGTHEVLFSDEEMGSGRGSAAFVDVGATPSVLRHTMGRQSSSLGGVIGSVLMGGLGVAIGLAGGLLMGFQDSSRPGSENLTLVGGVTLGVGVALGAGAVILGLNSRPEVQPGSTTQWVPTPP